MYVVVNSYIVLYLLIRISEDKYCNHTNSYNDG